MLMCRARGLIGQRTRCRRVASRRALTFRKMSLKRKRMYMFLPGFKGAEVLGLGLGLLSLRASQWALSRCSEFSSETRGGVSLLRLC